MSGVKGIDKYIKSKQNISSRSKMYLQAARWLDIIKCVSNARVLLVSIPDGQTALTNAEILGVEPTVSISS